MGGNMSSDTPDTPDVPELITIEEGCEDIGGKKKPCHPSTYYRGVRAGIYPPPVHPSPNISRIVRPALAAAIRAQINNKK
jgi:hypothetical protein